MKLGLVEQRMYREEEKSHHGCLKVQWLTAEKEYWNKPLTVTSIVSKTLTQDIVELQCHHFLSPFNEETTTFTTTNFWFIVTIGLPGGSAGAESICNVGDPDSIPGLGSSPGEGVGYPLLYSWTSLVAQTVKNLPAMWETWVWSLGREDPLEEGIATHSNILSERIHMDRGAGQATVHGATKSRTWLSDWAQHSTVSILITSKIPQFCKLLLETAKAIEIFDMIKCFLTKQSCNCKKIWAIWDLGTKSDLLLLEQVLLPL